MTKQWINFFRLLILVVVIVVLPSCDGGWRRPPEPVEIAWGRCVGTTATAKHGFRLRLAELHVLLTELRKVHGGDEQKLKRLAELEHETDEEQLAKQISDFTRQHWEPALKRGEPIAVSWARSIGKPPSPHREGSDAELSRADLDGLLDALRSLQSSSLTAERLATFEKDPSRANVVRELWKLVQDHWGQVHVPSEPLVVSWARTIGKSPAAHDSDEWLSPDDLLALRGEIERALIEELEQKENAFKSPAHAATNDDPWEIAVRADAIQSARQKLDDFATFPWEPDPVHEAKQIREWIKRYLGTRYDKDEPVAVSWGRTIGKPLPSPNTLSLDEIRYLITELKKTETEIARRLDFIEKETDPDRLATDVRHIVGRRWGYEHHGETPYAVPVVIFLILLLYFYASELWKRVRGPAGKSNVGGIGPSEPPGNAAGTPIEINHPPAASVDPTAPEPNVAENAAMGAFLSLDGLSKHQKDERLHQSLLTLLGRFVFLLALLTVFTSVIVVGVKSFVQIADRVYGQIFYSEPLAESGKFPFIVLIATVFAMRFATDRMPVVVFYLYAYSKRACEAMVDRIIAMAGESFYASRTEIGVRLAIAAGCGALTYPVAVPLVDLLGPMPDLASLDSLFDLFVRVIKASGCVFGVAVFALQTIFQLVPLRELIGRRFATIPKLKSIESSDAEGKYASGNPLLSIVHWSDLHITAANGKRAEGGEGGNAALRDLIMQYETLLSEGCDYILVTGDITDAGRAEEWKEFYDVVPAALRTRMIVLPGNHDINVTDPHKWLRFEAPDRPARNVRMIRMMAVMDDIQGESALVLGRDGELQQLRHFLAQNAASLRAFYQDPSSSRTDPQPIWDSIFPMAIELNKAVVIFLLDSNDRSSSIVTNAFGRIRKDAIGRLAKLESKYKNHCRIYALHHHVAMPQALMEEGKRNWVKVRAMTLQNGRIIVDHLVEVPTTVVFHGHRHIAYRGRLDRGNVEILSSQSTTLGDEYAGSKTPQFQRITLSRAEDEQGIRVERISQFPAHRPPDALEGG